MDVGVGLWRKLSTEKLMLLNCDVGEDSLESLGLQGDPTSPSSRRSVLGVHWKDWCWSWNSNTLATWCEELTHWKRPWCWEGLGAGGEGDNRGWDGWMASLTRWTWVWVNSGSCWWTGRPGVLPFMGSKRVRCDWATELNFQAGLRFSLQKYFKPVLMHRNKLAVKALRFTPRSLAEQVLVWKRMYMLSLGSAHLDPTPTLPGQQSPVWRY